MGHVGRKLSFVSGAALGVALVVTCTTHLRNKDHVDGNVYPSITTADGAPPASGQIPKAPSIMQLYTLAVIFLYVDEVDQIPIGTAFLTGHQVKRGGTDVIPLIVTAKHVIAGRKTVAAKFNVKSDQGTAFHTFDLDRLRVEGDLWEHPEADLVVFRTPVFLDVSLEPVPVRIIASKDTYSRENIVESDRIVFPSLLASLKGIKHDYAIMRDGTIALLPREPIYWDGSRNNEDVILINAAVNQGSSGAPVFLSPSTRSSERGLIFGQTPLLLGVIRGFFPAIPREVQAVDKVTNTETQLVTPNAPQRPMKLYFREDSRVGVYTPSWKLLEILESGKLKARMKQLGAEN